MGIRTKNCEEYTLLREAFGRTFLMTCPPDAMDQVIDDEFPVDASVVGTAVTLTTSPFYLPGWGMTVGFTDGVVTLDGSSSATFRITGTNQFGEPVIEDVTITNAAFVQSLNAFRKITSIVLTAKTGVGAGGTCDIGYVDIANGRRLGLPFKVRTAGDIAAVHGAVAASVPVLNPVVSTIYHTITLPTANFVTATITSTFSVVMADQANLKY